MFKVLPWIHYKIFSVLFLPTNIKPAKLQMYKTIKIDKSSRIKPNLQIFKLLVELRKLFKIFSLLLGFNWRINSILQLEIVCKKFQSIFRLEKHRSADFEALSDLLLAHSLSSVTLEYAFSIYKILNSRYQLNTSIRLITYKIQPECYMLYIIYFVALHIVNGIELQYWLILLIY